MLVHILSSPALALQLQLGLLLLWRHSSPSLFRFLNQPF